MAELDRSVSELAPTTTLPVGSLLMVAIEDQTSETGYDSRKIASEKVASEILSNYSLPLALNTTAKNITGAINELLGVVLTGTLLTGSTSITFQDPSILTSSTIEIFTDTFGVNPVSVTVGTGTMTITFEAQAADLGVKVVIK